MRICVLSNGLELSQAFRQRAEGRVWAALQRFARRVRWVTVRLEDPNGPRGGVDKCCRIEVGLERLGTLMTEHTASEALAALQGAAARLKPLVARRLKQRWQNQRQRSILGRRTAIPGVLADATF